MKNPIHPLKNSYLKIYLLVVFLRILLPPILYWFYVVANFQSLEFVVFAVLVGFSLDAIDAEFASRASLTRSDYQTIDKFLDLWLHFFILLAIRVFIPIHYVLFWILFLYRFLGQMLVLITKIESIFLLFPNIFGNFFLLIFFAKIFNFFELFNKGSNLYLFLFGVIVLSSLQEYFIHFQRKSLLKEILGIKRKWLK